MPVKSYGSAPDLFPAERPAAVFYLIGDKRPHAVFYNGPDWGRWPSIQESIATQIGCDPKDVSIREASWGDDGYAELVVAVGEIAGSFDLPLSKKAVAAIRRSLARSAPNLAVTKKPRTKKPKPRVPGQGELLLPISGSKPDAGKVISIHPRARKAG
jgi:hypothetical protein